MGRRKELKKILGRKRVRFCEAYIYEWNATQSAIKAGYSKRSARTTAARVLADSNVKEYIAIIRDELEEYVGISKQKVLNELCKIAFSSIRRLHNSWIDRINFELVPDDDRDAIESIETRVVQKNVGTRAEPEIVDVEQIKIKLYSKENALKQIREMLGYTPASRIDITSKGKEIKGVSLAELSTEELLARAEAAKKIEKT